MKLMNPEHLQKIKEFIYRRTKQEQIYILILIFLLTAYLWYLLLLTPLINKKKTLEEDFQSVSQQLQQLQEKITLFNSEKATLAQQYEKLKKQNTDLDRKLELYSLKTVSHAQVAALVRSLLQQGGDLQIETINSDIDPHKDVSHESITLVFVGNFYDTLLFFNRMKHSQYAWHIDEINYAVENFPKARITLKLTLKVK